MMKYYSKYLWALLLFLFTTAILNAQTITGVVNDEFGAPMPGVTVRIDGTTIGDATDLDGSWRIRGVGLSR